MAKPSEQMGVTELFGSIGVEGGGKLGSGQQWQLTLLKHLICSPGCYLICTENGISSKVFGIFQRIVTVNGRMEDAGMGKKRPSSGKGGKLLRH